MTWCFDHEPWAPKYTNDIYFGDYLDLQGWALQKHRFLGHPSVLLSCCPRWCMTAVHRFHSTQDPSGVPHQSKSPQYSGVERRKDKNIGNQKCPDSTPPRTSRTLPQDPRRTGRRRNSRGGQDHVYRYVHTTKISQIHVHAHISVWWFVAEGLAGIGHQFGVALCRKGGGSCWDAASCVLLLGVRREERYGHSGRYGAHMSTCHALNRSTHGCALKYIRAMQFCLTGDSTLDAQGPIKHTRCDQPAVIFRD